MNKLFAAFITAALTASLNAAELEEPRINYPTCDRKTELPKTIETSSPFFKPASEYCTTLFTLETNYIRDKEAARIEAQKSRGEALRLVPRYISDAKAFLEKNPPHPSISDEKSREMNVKAAKDAVTLYTAISLNKIYKQELQKYSDLRYDATQAIMDAQEAYREGIKKINEP